MLVPHLRRPISASLLAKTAPPADRLTTPNKPRGPDVTYPQVMRMGGKLLVNQDPSATVSYIGQIVPTSLPVLLRAWDAIEAVTGYKWINTSFLRDSPSHKMGHAIDLVAKMDPELERVYALTHKSDPVLHSRLALMLKLLPLTKMSFSPLCDLVIAVESDHLHVQIVKRGSAGPHPTNIYRWADTKPIYNDTANRNSTFEQTYQKDLSELLNGTTRIL